MEEKEYGSRSYNSLGTFKSGFSGTLECGMKRRS